MLGIIADAHIRGKGWEDKKRVLNQLKSHLKERNVRWLFNAGDLADNYGKWNDKYVTTNSVVDFLNTWLSSQELTLISVEGNHDQSGQESAYDVFQHPQQIVIKNEVKWVGIADHAFICVPWLTNNRVSGVDARLYAKEMIKECYNSIDKSKYTTINIIGHLDAVGAKIRNNISITSEEYSKYTFDFHELGKEVGYIDNIFLGHLHARQPIRARGEGYYGYIGYVSPLGHGEEANYDKFGWTYFDGKTVEFVQLDAPKYYSFQAKELDNYVDVIRDWDRVRIIGSPSGVIPSSHVEIVGEKLEMETVREYIENKNQSLTDIFKKWVDITEVSLSDDAMVIDYLEQVNIKWDSLTGKLTKLLSVELEDVGPHQYFKHEFQEGFTAILGPNGRGKAQPLDSLVLTPSGYTRMGDITVGSRVVDELGNLVKVTSVHPQGDVVVYEVTFSDGCTTKCCGDHLWKVKKVNKDKLKSVWEVKSIKELLPVYKRLHTRGTYYHQYKIPMVNKINFYKKNLTVDPYLLGLLLGDGCLVGGTPTYSTDDIELIQYVKDLLPQGVGCKKLSGYSYSLSANKSGVENGNLLTKQLRNLGVMGSDSYTKHIPEMYKLSDYTDRLAILQGLMDTDGHACATGGAQYATVSLKLAEGVVWLAQSLGGTAAFNKNGKSGNRNNNNNSILYRLNVKTPMNPFKLKRKASAWVPPLGRPCTRTIRDIQYVGVEKCQCISVDSPTSTYLTNDCIVTHNTWVLEAFPYAIFGEWPTKRGSQSSYMTPSSKVTVRFSIEGVDYTVIRTLKGLVVHDKLNNEITGKLKRSSKEFLEKLLGENRNFSQCCFSDQKSNNGLIDCDPSSRMQVLRDFLKLDIFDTYHEEVKAELNSYKSELAKLQSQLELKSDTEASITQLESKRTNLDMLIATVTLSKQLLSDKIDLYADNYTLEQKALFKKSQVGELKKQVDSISTKMRQLSLQHLTDTFPLGQEVKDKSNKDLRILKDKRKVLYGVKDKKSSLRMTLNGSNLNSVGCSPNYLPCPLINKLIEAKAELEKMEDVDPEIGELTQAINEIEKSLSDDEKNVTAAKVVTQRLEEYSRDSASLNRNILALNKDIEGLIYQPITIDFKQLKLEYDSANAQMVTLTRQHQAITSELMLAEKKLKELQSIETTRLPQLNYQIESYTVLEKAFSKYGIPHYLASSALPELQEIFNSIIKVGFDDKMVILFDNISEPSKKMKENFSIIKVNARNAHDVRYCSPGEQSVLQTLWKLTLLTFQARRNEGYRVLFLDEPTHWQDEANVEASMRVLRYVSGQFDQIIMVTHDETLAELADHKVVLE